MDKKETPSQKRAHIYEIDLIRAITVFSVVAVHSLSATSFLVKNRGASFDFLNLVMHLLHYNREMFIFVTGLVLSYVYFERQFSAKSFWKKRFLLVFIPYIFWSIVYTVISHPHLDFRLISESLDNILSGNASYQLYYILLAVEFYAFFPYFIKFMRKVTGRPFLVLGISFLVQIIFMQYSFHFLQTGAVHLPEALRFLSSYQDRIFLTYEFFFILGAFAGIFLKESYDFHKKYGIVMPFLFLAGLWAFILYYYWEIKILHESIWHATSVLQPSVVIYSTIVILFFTWIATIWAVKRSAYFPVKTISDTSFGIYLVHILFLNFTTGFLLPLLPGGIPIFLKMLFVILAVFLSSTVFCFILLKVKFLSWTIGRFKI